ncbi:hypothetical protein [Crocosphaera watsonii]|uniref:hypothetical protein n=1 Tax=Crocosphaera watsonii TaxID=263511 RepID=UPI000651EF19|nr:hypothetical protein [Crocosphaera watsonii]
MFRPQPKQKRRTPERINAGTGLIGIAITIVALIVSMQGNLTKLRADSEMIKQDISEIKGQIYPRTEAEAQFNALQNEFQSGDRLLEEKIKHLEQP